MLGACPSSSRSRRRRGQRREVAAPLARAGSAAATLALATLLTGCPASQQPLRRTNKHASHECAAMVRLYDGTPLAGHPLAVICADGARTVRTDAKGHFSLKHSKDCELAIRWLGGLRRFPLHESNIYGTGRVLRLPPVHRLVVTRYRGKRATDRFVLDERVPPFGNLRVRDGKLWAGTRAFSLDEVKPGAKLVVDHAPTTEVFAKPPAWATAKLTWFKASPLTAQTRAARLAFEAAKRAFDAAQTDKLAAATRALGQAQQRGGALRGMRRVLARAALAIGEARLRALLSATRANLTSSRSISAVLKLIKRVQDLAEKAREDFERVGAFKSVSRDGLHAALRVGTVMAEQAWWTGVAFTRIPVPSRVRALGEKAIDLYNRKLDAAMGKRVGPLLREAREAFAGAAALKKRVGASASAGLAVLADAKVKLPTLVVDIYLRVESIKRESWLPIVLRDAPDADDVKAAPVRVADAAGHSFGRSKRSPAVRNAQHVVKFGRLLGLRTLLAVGRCSDRSRLVKALRDVRLERPRAMGLSSHVVFGEDCAVTGPPPPGGSRLIGGAELLWALGLTKRSLRTPWIVALGENGALLKKAALLGGGMNSALAALSSGWAALAAARPAIGAKTLGARSSAAAVALLARATKAQKGNKLSDARRLVERAIKADPGNAEARRLRARLATMLGDISTASADVAWWRDTFGDLSADELEDELNKLRRKRKGR